MNHRQFGQLAAGSAFRGACVGDVARIGRAGSACVHVATCTVSVDAALILRTHLRDPSGFSIMLTQGFVPLRESRQFFPGEPSQQTIWRWTVKGVRGVVLKSLVVGGVRYVHPDWIEEFVRQQNSCAGFLAGGK